MRREKAERMTFHQTSMISKIKKKLKLQCEGFRLILVSVDFLPPEFPKKIWFLKKKPHLLVLTGHHQDIEASSIPSAVAFALRQKRMIIEKCFSIKVAINTSTQTLTIFESLN